MADTWHVTGQEQTTARMPDGRFGDVVRVRFHVDPIDFDGHVDIAVSTYNAETARNAIAAYVAKLTTTHKL